jgi:catechol 2,3-dioxygenase-like lactoylglutathione lyase family enzyme
MFTGIRSLAVYVTDLERAKSFYTERLGFQSSFNLGPDLCFLRSSNGTINICLQGGMAPAATDSNSVRLSFFLQATAPAAEIYGALKAAGVAILQPEPEEVANDTACFQILDPDGNIIEISGSK